MIVVIADDFSGAAEIAGIAWRYGLRTVLQTEPDLSVDDDIVILDTDTRSKEENEARKIHYSLARILNLNQSKIDWLYKKIDSVLRGYIIAEIDSLAVELHKNKVLIVPNNPSVGKVIRNNTYYIDNQRLHETDFKLDPEFPAKSSVVTEILGASKILPVTYITSKNSLPGSGIFIPDITSLNDLSRRAIELDEETLPVGGSDFFNSLLEAKGYTSIETGEVQEKQLNRRRFFVLASTSEQSRKFCKNIKNSGIPVCNLPCTTAHTSQLTEDCLRRWVNCIKTSFNKNQTVVSTVMHPVNRESDFTNALHIFISQMIKEVLEKVELDELLIEGGATSSHFVRYVGWKNFAPLREYSTGVVKLKVGETSHCTMIVKPGSYPWPEHFLPTDII
jgi:uncharacterized protein YgbK (DUF1537 family)